MTVFTIGALVGLLVLYERSNLVPAAALFAVAFVGVLLGVGSTFGFYGALFDSFRDSD